MLTFQVEKFKDVWPELCPLTILHWSEIHPGRESAYKPNVKQYQHFNDIGFLHIFTARHEGVLVGQAVIYVTESMHTQQKMAREDTWYFLPEFRRGRNAIDFLKYIENTLRENGVVEFHATAPERQGRILTYMGYDKTMNVYQKILESEDVRTRTSQAA